MSDPHQEREALLRKEASFWNLQEENIASLYARPHDWRFVPTLAERIIAPRVRTIERIVRQNREEVRSLLDIGCGNGWFCHAAARRGIRCVGIDLSEKKIETARRLAREQQVEHLCEFVAGDVLAWQPREPVDLLASHGSLHHFPGLEQALAHMVERFLRPGGLMLFIEPNHEGPSPSLREALLRFGRSRWTKGLFDIDFFLEVSGQKDIETPPPPPAEGAVNIRHESPAGLQFFSEHLDLDRFFSEHYQVVESHFFHYLSGHATNAFYVFMKSRLLRGLWRALLPMVVWYDGRLLRRTEYQRYAEEGLWLLRPRPG